MVWGGSQLYIINEKYTNLPFDLSISRPIVGVPATDQGNEETGFYMQASINGTSSFLKPSPSVLGSEDYMITSKMNAANNQQSKTLFQVLVR